MVDVKPNGGANWMCQCDCGNSKIISTKNLLHSRGLTGTLSCGCLVKENHIKTHDKSNSKQYLIWQKMKSRCYNKRHKHYKYYGGRGILICDEWLNDFERFYNWSVESGYKDGLTIDRIDNDLGYSPDNCRWATRKEQSNNTRANHLLTHNGKTLNTKQWSEETGIKYTTIQSRIRSGFRVDEILSKDKLYSARRCV